MYSIFVNVYRENTLHWLNYWPKWCARALSNNNESSMRFNLEMNKKYLLNEWFHNTLIVFKYAVKIEDQKKQHKAQNSWEKLLMTISSTNTFISMCTIKFCIHRNRKYENMKLHTFFYTWADNTKCSRFG
jgi:hypothetical protein